MGEGLGIGVAVGKAVGLGFVGAGAFVDVLIINLCVGGLVYGGVGIAVTRLARLAQIAVRLIAHTLTRPIRTSIPRGLFQANPGLLTTDLC